MGRAILGIGQPRGSHPRPGRRLGTPVQGRSRREARWWLHVAVGVSTKTARLRDEARALRAIGLTAPEVGLIIERHPSWVRRYAAHVEYDPNVPLPTARARRAARALQRMQAHRYQLGVDRLDRRVAKILALQAQRAGDGEAGAHEAGQARVAGDTPGEGAP